MGKGEREMRLVEVNRCEGKERKVRRELRVRVEY
jgi:hypothetical protein